MPSFRWVPIAFLAVSGCLSTPGPNETDAGRGSGDASTTTDASSSDAPTATDASTGTDAIAVGMGTSFPPAMTDVDITGAWSGDLNGDQVDDVLLLSDTGDPASAGVYVLLGQLDSGVPEYHQFLASGTEAPLAVTATQLDGVGALDIVVYDVQYDSMDPADSLAYLRAYIGAGVTFTEPPVENHVTAVQLDEWKPRTPGEEVKMIAARIDVNATAPGFAVVHHRGAFVLTIPSWSNFNWQQTAPEVLIDEGCSGLGAVPNDTNPVDDLILWTDQAPEVRWLVNDGHGAFARSNVLAAPPAPDEAQLFDMDGVDPLDVVGYLDTGIQAIPTDDVADPNGSFLDGQSYISNMDGFREILVMDTNQPGIDERPEIIVASADCEGPTTDPCLLMIRNAYIHTASGELRTDQSWVRYFLPAGFVPDAVVHGDFDGDAVDEVVIFSSDGSQDCVRIADATFAACD
jgi:hypothetical protein